MKIDFTEERFPEDISFGAVGGPEYKTEILSSISGTEYRNIRWSNSRSKYNVSYGIKTKEQITKILSFFRARRGRAIGFRFKDWCDYQVENELIGTGDNTTKVFQLIKNYKSQEHSYVRIINKPIIETVNIYINNKIFPSEDYKINHNKGIIEFLSPPANGVNVFATFEFDVPVRFDSDYLPVSIDDHNVFSCNSINLIEIKLIK